MSIAHYKEPGAVETRTSDIQGSIKHQIWKYSPDTDTAISLGSFQAGISGNTSTFDVDETLVGDLARVASKSFVGRLHGTSPATSIQQP